MLLFFESYFPIRITTDEPLVMPDVNFLMHNFSLSQAKYFSGVAYQFQTTTLLRLSGLDTDFLQVQSPIIGAIAFAVFFAVSLLLFRGEAGSPWWGFGIPAVGLLVFPGFIIRMIESTHKSYTFPLLFLSLYLVYRLSRSDMDRRALVLVLLFLSGITLLNYIWGFVYAGLIGVVALGLRTRRVQTIGVSVTAGVIAIVTPGLSSVRRYHRAYFNAVTNRLEKISSALQQDRATDDGESTSVPDGNSTTTPSEGSQTPTPDKTSSSSSASEVNASVSGPRFGEDPETTVGGLERIGLWDPIEIAGIGISSWYLYSLGIGLVATITAVTGSICVWLLARRRLGRTGRLTLAVLVYHGAMFGAFWMLGDIATLKRIVVVPGFFGLLSFVLFLSDKSLSVPLSRQQRHAGLAVLLVALLLTAGIATGRLPTGGDKPTDIYIEAPDTRQAEWILEHGVSDDCFIVKQELVAHYYQRQSQLRRGSGISHSGTEPIRVNSVYQSRQNDGTAFVCR